MLGNSPIHRLLMSRGETQIVWYNKNLYLQLLSGEQKKSFPLALIDCLQQEKHRLSPLAGAMLSDVIITTMPSLNVLPK